MKFVYPNTTATFSGARETAVKAGYKEISDELYSELVEQKKIWQDGEIVDNPNWEEVKREKERREAQQRIIDEVNSLKRQLSETDYMAIKHSEGWITDEEYAPTKALRQTYRDRINELENEIDEKIEEETEK